MARYIDADEMIVDTKAMKNIAGAIEIDGIVKYIEEHISADVQEVKHAYWETREEEVYGIVPTDFKICSNCGKEYTSVFMAACCEDFETDVILFHFCPYCGAKMDGKDESK